MEKRACIFRILAVLHALFIFLLVPCGRLLQQLIEGSSVLSILQNSSVVISAAVLAALAALIYTCVVIRLSGKTLLIKCAATGLAACALLFLRGFSAWVEYVHIPIFALLAALINLGWRRGIVVTLVTSASIGLIDEIFQGIHPERVFDPYDIWLNFLSSLLGLLVLLPLIPTEKNRQAP